MTNLADAVLSARGRCSSPSFALSVFGMAGLLAAALTSPERSERVQVHRTTTHKAFPYHAAQGMPHLYAGDPLKIMGPDSGG